MKDENSFFLPLLKRNFLVMCYILCHKYFLKVILCLSFFLHLITYSMDSEQGGYCPHQSEYIYGHARYNTKQVSNDAMEILSKFLLVVHIRTASSLLNKIYGTQFWHP